MNDVKKYILVRIIVHNSNVGYVKKDASVNINNERSSFNTNVLKKAIPL